VVQKFREEGSGFGAFLPDLFTPFTALGKDVDRNYEKRVFN